MLVLASNLERVTAICTNRDASNHDVIIGDATTDATHGTHVSTILAQKLDVTSAIFAYSQLGSSAFGCQEIVRP